MRKIVQKNYSKTDIVCQEDCVLYTFTHIMHTRYIYTYERTYIFYFILFFLKNEYTKWKRMVFEIEDMINLHCAINHVHETLGPFVLRTDDFSA